MTLGLHAFACRPTEWISEMDLVAVLVDSAQAFAVSGAHIC